MYEPLFNTVLVEIDDSEAKWGNGNDDSMLGKSYREGVVVSVGLLVPTNDYPFESLSKTHEALLAQVENCLQKHVMWNEGVEAGTVHEVDGKQYAFIYWWDLRASKS
jgi:hypothetical protein